MQSLQMTAPDSGMKSGECLPNLMFQFVGPGVFRVDVAEPGFVELERGFYYQVFRQKIADIHDEG